MIAERGKPHPHRQRRFPAIQPGMGENEKNHDDQ
jgi:hypothetical protein